MLDNLGIEQLTLKLAELMNVSADFIQNNFNDYVLQYAKYMLVENIFSFTFILIIIMLVGNLIIYPLLSLGYEFEELKKSIIIVLGVELAILLLAALSNVVLYLYSPYIYGLKSLIGLLK